MHAARVDVLDRRRFSGRLVYCINSKRILAADEDALAFHLGGGIRTINAIHKSSVRMHVHGAGGLP